MITPLSEQKIKQLFNLEFLSSAKITQFGGVQAFIAFLVKAKFQPRLEAVVGKPAAKAILQVMLGTFVGADTMESIARVTQDRAIKGYIGEPVGATQIVRILQSLRPSQVQALHEFALSRSLLDIVSSARDQMMLILDVDATPLEKYGRQEGVEHGYVGENQIDRCYQYLFFRVDHLNTLLYGTIRGGSAHSQNNICGYLKMILPTFGGKWPLCFRGDSGYFNEEAFELCCENTAWFFVKAPMSLSRQAQATSDQLVWVADPKDEHVEYASYETLTKSGWTWREVFKRVRQMPAQGDLFPHYHYDCIATNDMKRTGPQTYDFYNKRARIENTNCELKHDYNLGSVVTQSFAVNDVITQAIILLYQNVSHFKRTCLDKADQPRRLSTLRTLIFNVPARILSSGRRTWYRLENVFRDKLAYGRILARIQALRTIFVLAPFLPSD